jgi:plastocyanin
MRNTKYRFDKRILTFFIFVIIISSGALVYKYYTTKKCPEINFTISNVAAEVGEIIDFNNRTVGAESVKWDFGDNSVQLNEASPTHTYKAPGEYMMKITINNQCQEMRKIVVKPKKLLVNEDLVPKFQCTDNIALGKLIRFACTSKDSKSWEWRFGETGKVDSREKTADYIYKTPGAKTVSLVINGRYSYIAKKVIYIIAPAAPKIGKPLPKAPPKAATPFIPQAPEDYSSYDAVKTAPKKEVERAKIMSNEDLQAAIISYSKGKTKVSQFAPSFCEKVEASTVEANGKLMNFTEFLEKILWQNVTIKELRTIRDSNGCISQVILKYKKN